MDDFKVYAQTISLCPVCAGDCVSEYTEHADGMRLNIYCEEHGVHVEQVERDVDFFKAGYEIDYVKAYDHFAVPVTYRCNINCKYCYSLSNSNLRLPPDRTVEELEEIFAAHPKNITLIGGEPTVRDDLPLLIKLAKETHSDRKVCLATNGVKLADMDYLKGLMRNGLDYLFMPVNDVAYECSPTVYKLKLVALDNCVELRLPVWFQQTIDGVYQLDSTAELLERFRRVIFKVTIRTVGRYGLNQPEKWLFMSDILRHLGKSSDYKLRNHPFNRQIHWCGKRVKICSPTNDMGRLDTLDFDYLTSDGRLTAFHRGIKIDEVLIMNGARASVETG